MPSAKPSAKPTTVVCIVRCRLRRRPDGDKLLLQVWDSGIGISEGSLPRIFDEFYQVQRQRPLAAHQRKGLGLAIVSRLSKLMSAPIGVRSRVGRGMVFSFEVPVRKAARALEPAADKVRSPLGLTLQRWPMLVVEDEAAVRYGLVVLLKAWGASVAAFETLSAVQDWLGHCWPKPPTC